MLVQASGVLTMEGSKGMRFGGYPAGLGVRGGGVGEVEGEKVKVQDFDWVRLGPSPNWSYFNEEEEGQSGSSPSASTQGLLEVLGELEAKHGGVGTEEVKQSVEKLLRIYGL